MALYGRVCTVSTKQSSCLLSYKSQWPNLICWLFDPILCSFSPEVLRKGQVSLGSITSICSALFVE